MFNGIIPRGDCISKLKLGCCERMNELKSIVPMGQPKTGFSPYYKSIFGTYIIGRRTKLTLTAATIIIACAACTDPTTDSPQATEAQVLNMSQQGAAPARDGNIAIQEEFDAALEANTFAAWDLFIRRHPDHPLTVMAREHLNKLIADNNANN